MFTSSSFYNLCTSRDHTKNFNPKPFRWSRCSLSMRVPLKFYFLLLYYGYLTLNYTSSVNAVNLSICMDEIIYSWLHFYFLHSLWHSAIISFISHIFCGKNRFFENYCSCEEDLSLWVTVSSPKSGMGWRKYQASKFCGILGCWCEMWVSLHVA